MEELSVCLINDSFPPLIDGVANTVKNYAKIITENYGKATVAVPFYPGADDSGYPYKVVRFPSINTEKLVNYRAGYPFSAETLEKVQKENINIIHTHCPFASAFLARTLREPLDAPVIFTYHTKFDIDINRAVRSKFIQKKVLNQLVRNIEACDEVWVVSEGAGENLRSIGYKGNYVVMPNGVDIPKGRVSQEEIEKATAGYDLPAGVPVFLFVGRMAWYKGIDIILDSLYKIANTGKDFRMVFIGGGFDKEDIEKYAEKLCLGGKCIFTGPIQNRDVIRAWYCRANLFLFPSVYDTNGLVVREAAACSLASLLIAGSCAAEGIVDGDTGFICENNAESFSRKLLEIINSPEVMQKTGENAAEKIYISWEDAVANAAERYRIVLQNYREGKYKKPETYGDEWLRTEGEILEGINRAKALRREYREEIKLYGKDMLSIPAREIESFKQRTVKLKEHTKAKTHEIKKRTVQKGREATNAFWDKVDKYW